MLTWKQVPSVTTGGKPFFYNAYDSFGRYRATVVWRRDVHAYAVEVGGRVVAFVSTVENGQTIAAAHTGRS